jgi:hypothetical protein
MAVLPCTALLLVMVVEEEEEEETATGWLPLLLQDDAADEVLPESGVGGECGHCNGSREARWSGVVYFLL